MDPIPFPTPKSNTEPNQGEASVTNATSEPAISTLIEVATAATLVDAGLNALGFSNEIRSKDQGGDGPGSGEPPTPGQIPSSAPDNPPPGEMVRKKSPWRMVLTWAIRLLGAALLLGGLVVLVSVIIPDNPMPSQPTPMPTLPPPTQVRLPIIHENLPPHGEAVGITIPNFSGSYEAWKFGVPDNVWLYLGLELGVGGYGEVPFLITIYQLESWDETSGIPMNPQPLLLPDDPEHAEFVLEGGYTYVLNVIYTTGIDDEEIRFDITQNSFNTLCIMKVTSSQGANVRDVPETGDVLARIPRAMPVYVIGAQPGAYRVFMPRVDREPIIGYITMDALGEIEPSSDGYYFYPQCEMFTRAANEET